jgi:hypothetical protein
LIGKGFISKDGEGLIPGLVEWTLTFPMEKENGIFNPLGREGSVVKHVKREEAFFIHKEKKGNFTIHVGQSGKKEGPSKCCSKGGERSSILKEGMRGLSQSLRDVDLWNPSFYAFC